MRNMLSCTSENSHRRIDVTLIRCQMLCIFLIAMILLSGCHSETVPFSEAATNSNIEGSTEVSSLSLQETKALDLEGLEGMSITSGSNETTKTNEKTDTNEMANTNETAKNNVTTIEDGKVTFSKEGLYIGDLREEVESLLGAPEWSDQAAGVSIVCFEHEKNYESEVGFVSNHLAYIETNHPNLELPGSVGVNKSILTAFEIYTMSPKMESLGFKRDMTVEAFKKGVRDKKINVMSFTWDDSLLITLFFDSENLVINRIKIVDNTRSQTSIQFELSDLELSPMGLVDKYGYPTDIFTYNGEAAELYFDKEYGTNSIQMMNTSKPFRLSFMCYKADKESSGPVLLDQTWKGPYGIRVGEDIRLLIRKLGLPDNNERCHIALGMTDAQMAEVLSRNASGSEVTFSVEDVLLNVSYDKEKLSILGWRLLPRDKSDFLIQQKQVPFTVPKFDPESVMTDEDMYLSNLSNGSSRKAVFEQLGAPISLKSDFNVTWGMYQECTFKEGQVTFAFIEDYDDLDSGSAFSFKTRAKHLVGPRGIRVGDPIEKLLELIPGTNEINFNALGVSAQVYPILVNNIQEYAIAVVQGSAEVPNSGYVLIENDWFLSCCIFYDNGVVTEISFEHSWD